MLLHSKFIITLFTIFIQLISGCVVLPNEEILVGGFDNAQKSSAIYNLLENKWYQVEDSMHNKHYTGLVVLGSRIFSTAGGLNDRMLVEEFDYSSRTWKSVETPLLQPRYLHSVIPMPAEVFAHLPGGCQGVA